MLSKPRIELTSSRNVRFNFRRDILGPLARWKGQNVVHSRSVREEGGRRKADIRLQNSRVNREGAGRKSGMTFGETPLLLQLTQRTVNVERLVYRIDADGLPLPSCVDCLASR